jgi:hypothetical protein
MPICTLASMSATALLAGQSWKKPARKFPPPVLIYLDSAGIQNGIQFTNPGEESTAPPLYPKLYPARHFFEVKQDKAGKIQKYILTRLISI